MRSSAAHLGELAGGQGGQRRTSLVQCIELLLLRENEGGHVAADD